MKDQRDGTVRLLLAILIWSVGLTVIALSVMLLFSLSSELAHRCRDIRESLLYLSIGAYCLCLPFFELRQRLNRFLHNRTVPLIAPFTVFYWEFSTEFFPPPGSFYHASVGLFLRIGIVAFLIWIGWRGRGPKIVPEFDDGLSNAPEPEMIRLKLV
jgi:hypothetical protein